MNQLEIHLPLSNDIFIFNIKNKKEKDNIYNKVNMWAIKKSDQHNHIFIGKENPL